MQIRSPDHPLLLEIVVFYVAIGEAEADYNRSLLVLTDCRDLDAVL